jgi:hypothetical protein
MADKAPRATGRTRVAKQPDPKEAGEARKLIIRRLYLAGRIASLKEEHAALQKERTDIDTRLKGKPGGAEEKKLKQRRVYVTMRPESLRSEINAANAEMKEVLVKLGPAAA